MHPAALVEPPHTPEDGGGRDRRTERRGEDMGNSVDGAPGGQATPRLGVHPRELSAGAWTELDTAAFAAASADGRAREACAASVRGHHTSCHLPPRGFMLSQVGQAHKAERHVIPLVRGPAGWDSWRRKGVGGHGGLVQACPACPIPLRLTYDLFSSRHSTGRHLQKLDYNRGSGVPESRDLLPQDTRLLAGLALTRPSGHSCL